MIEEHDNHHCLEPDSNYNAVAMFDDGAETKIYANQLRNKNLDYFKGWSCLAGMTRLYIDSNGDVFSCERKNSYLGNIKSQWAPHNEPTLCTQTRCGACTDDLMTEKFTN
jgi:hypothetical protein